MDFELSPDQVALQEAARDLLDDRAGHDQVRAHLASGRPYDESLWKALSEQGWLAIALAEADGGVGLGWVEAAILLEQIGRHTAPVPFLPSLLAVTVLSAAEQPSPEWVAALSSGERIGLRGLEQACRCSGRRAGRETGGPCRAGSGRSRGPRWRTLPSSSRRPVSWPSSWKRSGARRPSRRWTAPGCSPGCISKGRPPRTSGAPNLATEIVDRGAIAAAAEILGGSDRVLEMAVQYAKDRVQFDQPIGSFQAIKHRCADMVVDVEGMRSATWYAAWAISAGDPDASAAASTTKVWSSDAAKRVMASGLQVHGGIGFTWEHDLHLYMKRSQFDRLNFGDAGFHRERLAGLLRSRLLSGSSVF